MDTDNCMNSSEIKERQSLIDCYRIALDFGLAAGNLAAEQILLQSSDMLAETYYSE